MDLARASKSPEEMCQWSNIFLIQKNLSYPMILGQPYITSSRMDMKVLEDGSAYARIRSTDSKKSVQFLTVRREHDKNKEELRINLCRHDMSTMGQIFKRDDQFANFLNAEDIHEVEEGDVCWRMPKDA